MRLLFSEAPADYSLYLYPYVIWALPDPGESPADLFQRGFLPASPQLDRFYLCRNLRVDLARYRPSSENRRILRKGQPWTARLVPRADFDFSEARRAAWKAYADQRFGEDIMSFQRLDTLMCSPVINHLLVFEERDTGKELGTVLLYLEEPSVAYYYYAFYDVDHIARGVGIFMMTWAAEFFARRDTRYLHLGTCYSEKALYKAQFQGLEFFNGNRWSIDVEELKYLVRRQGKETPETPHLLASPDYLDKFQPGGLLALARSSHFHAPGSAPPRDG